MIIPKGSLWDRIYRMIINGDSREELKKLDTNSIDLIVTDPPYGLSAARNSGKTSKGGFMGKEWDYDVPSIEIWKECLRVLKPGGYLLSFAGTRTQHRMACNIEDAGFEIRDMIAWVYGSGFPKSLNIGKAVDKLQGNAREVIGEKIRGDVEKAKQNGNTFAVADANKNNKDIFGYGIETLTKGNSEWEGWGTSLKPAFEPITVARKPLSEKTVAENVLKWGTGGINIDGCRVGTEDKLNGGATTGSVSASEGWDRPWRHNQEAISAKSERAREQVAKGELLGRFPSNFIHDGSDEVLGLFPNTKSSGKYNKTGDWKNTGDGKIRTWDIGYDKLNKYAGEEGSAARFFYTAKASKSERDKGCENLKDNQIAYNTGNNHNVAPLGRETKYKNSHPCVKPVRLMTYLITLGSRKGDVILDPFCGSGTTGVSCKITGRKFIGIELDEYNCKISVCRINAEQPVLQEKLELI